jgi:Ran-binding protein 3
MSLERDNAVHSDTENGENGERPVREQLKNARITQDHHAAVADSSTSTAETPSSNDTLKPQPQGELRRKRSFEEVDDSQAKDAPSESVRHHTRKRSRDSTAEEFELNNGRRKTSGERSRTRADGADVEEETMTEANGSAKPHRASTPETSADKQNETSVEEVASPKTKRSRLHSSTADEETQPKTTAPTSNGTAKEPVATKIPPTSGFANASATSPFGALAGSKSPSAEPTTSSSAFAASGFGALSGSTTSGFGSIAKSGGGFGSGGSFASGAKSPLGGKEAETSKPSSSGFGGALGQTSAFASAGSSTLASGFGSASSGFGRLGSPNAVGFGTGGSTAFGSLSGAALGGGGGLTSFASGKTAAAPLGGASKPTRAFGAPAAEADEDDGSNAGDDEEGVKSPLSTEEEKQDERFYAQSLETGEEDETTAFTSRAKLYNFTFVGEGEKEGKKKEWRERGLGVLRLNVKEGEDGEKPKARLLMRADGSHRVVLNTPVTKEIKFGTPSGGAPQGGYMYFMGTIGESGGLELLQLKVSFFEIGGCERGKGCVAVWS